MNKMIFNITQFLIFTENLHTYPNGHIIEIRKLKRMKENAIKIIGVMLTLICSALLSLMYLPYLAILFGMLAILLPAAIIMSPFIFAENYFKRKEEDEKQKARDELWQKFKKGEIDEDELEYELEFLN